MGWTTSRVSPASSGSGAVTAYWCWTGTSGSSTPASRATFGPQIPAARTTVSVRIVPRVVSTARTAPRSISKPVTVQWPSACTPAAVAIASAARSAFAIPSVGVWNPPRIRSGSISGTSSRTCSGASSAAGSP